MAKRWHRTIDTHLGAHTPPDPNYYEKTWCWESSRVGYKDPNVLFTTLHEEYNTLKCAIQDPEAWHRDVSCIARASNNNDEFLTLLKQRQAERFHEIQTTWQKIKTRLITDPARWDNPPTKAVLWSNFLQFARNFSYDCLVTCFGAYATDAQPSAQPLLSNSIEVHPSKVQKLKREPKEKMAASSGVTKSSPKASKSRPKSRPKRDGSRQDSVRRSTRLQQRAEQSKRQCAGRTSLEEKLNKAERRFASLQPGIVD
ncbi:unnamed protein product [Penicillium roqueforti FM164]|uniref:Genomic scaffold, ProqFM164S01 n=1 Tax=Penicillium roqueforti (strain FM164) TaxID=1365484 RepID=W6Q9S3_PENRF|nr:unnamed protein product [Penicillium roqueforti FM164]